MRLHPVIHVYTYLGDDAVECGKFENAEGIGHFEYGADYLKNADAHPIDPIHLPLSPQKFSTDRDGGFFGVFLDCCPQEWGQRVMHLMGQRFIAERSDPALLEAFINEGLSDPHNMMISGSGYGTGSLRFGMAPHMTADMLEPDVGEYNMNDLSQIRRIAEVLARAEDNCPLSEEDKALLIPGMSLGGARPKALVVDNGELWIAKFYRAREEVDIQRVEMAVNALASKAGIRVAESRAEVIEIGGQERTIFLSKRFDRRDGLPVHYISALTTLECPRTAGARNGAKVDIRDAQGQYSYSDIAMTIRQMSSSAREDLHELYRRMAFNAMVGNRDDHLGNHGFLLDPVGPFYRLSPAFDLAIVPNQPPMHPINLGPQGRKGTMENVLAAAGDFNLRPGDAGKILREVAAAVDEWPRVMASYHVSDMDVAWVRPLVMTQIEARIAEAEKAVKGPRDKRSSVPRLGMMP